MSQLIKPQIKWTPEKIQLLRDEYPLGNKHLLAERLGIKWTTLKDAARRFKIRSLVDPRGYKAAKLLDGSLESYYWHGFIMADGHISNRNSINIILSRKDEEQLVNFRKFLNIDHPLKYRCYDTDYIKNAETVGIVISDVDTCEKFRSLYEVGNKKTINAPNISHINNKEKLLSFFIGFFDGDGCFDIRRNYISAMKIECHPNWYNTLDELSKKFKQYFAIDFTLKMTKRGYACLRLYKYHNFMFLKELISLYNLPAMSRKWDNVDMNRIYRGGPNNFPISTL